MPSLDHLITSPVHLTGTVLSVKPLREGQSFVICDDSGVNIGNRRRWVGDSRALTTPVEVRRGDLCTFLPGLPRKQGAMHRAFDVTILPRNRE